MHRICYILLFLLPMLSAGQNLVLNGDFENHSACPNSSSDIGRCEQWDAVWGSPDYFHICGTGSGAAPQNFMGHQIPASDSAYIGLGVYTTIFAGGQEVVTAILQPSLIESEDYRVRFKASYADSANYAVCCLGAILSSTPPPAGPYSQNISSVEFVLQESDFGTTTWLQLDGVYTAQGGEDKIYLGTFRPESEMNPVHVRPDGDQNYDIAYFYIDDVEVYEDETVSLDELVFTFSIYPNPVNSNLTIESRTPLAQLWLSDMAGRVVWKETLRSAQRDRSIDVSALPSGIYLVEAITEDGRRSVQKVVVE